MKKALILALVGTALTCGLTQSAFADESSLTLKNYTADSKRLFLRVFNLANPPKEVADVYLDPNQIVGPVTGWASTGWATTEFDSVDVFFINEQGNTVNCGQIPRDTAMGTVHRTVQIDNCGVDAAGKKVLETTVTDG